MQNSSRPCRTCHRQLPKNGTCPRCIRPSAVPATNAQAFARSLRSRTAGPPQSHPEPGFWGSVTGITRREQETRSRRAAGTVIVTLTGAMAPTFVAIATGLMPASRAADALLSVLSLLLMPVALLVLLMSLGPGGPFSFIGRVVSSAWGVGIGLAAHQRSRPRRSGRALILDSGRGQTRVQVARDIEIPIGSTVTVHGPRLAGYRHAWFIQVHGLDHRALPARGVVAALISLGFGIVFSCITMLVALLGMFS